MDMKTALAKANTGAQKAASFLTTDKLQDDLNRARTLAHWLDAKFEVGGVKFGLQGIVGLLPIGGDAITTVAGLYPLVVAYRHKLGGEVVAKLMLNLGAQFGMGLVPWVGDYADVWFKANLRNLKVLENAVAAQAK